MTPSAGQDRPRGRGFKTTSGRWIREGFLDSAQSFARSAMRALSADDLPVFYLHGGTVIEQLCKGYLAFHHPALVCDRDFDSLLHACGFPKKARRPALSIKTVTAREAFDRAALLLPPLAHLAKDVNLFLDLRNGVAHFVLLTPRAATRDRVALFKAVAALIPSLPVTPEEFWGDYFELVQLVLTENATETDLRVAGRIVLAKTAFEARYAGLDKKSRSAVIHALEQSDIPTMYDEDWCVCPACDCMGVAGGTYEVEWKEDWDYGEQYDPRGIYPEVTFYPGHFLCRVCGLELDGDGELEAGGVPISWEIEDVDPKDFRNDDDYD